MKKSFKEWCLENGREDMLEQWDYERNNIGPDEVEAMSNAGIYFVCKKCGKRYRRQLYTIVKFGRYCPECELDWIEENEDGDDLSNRLSYNFPELLEEWDYEKNKDFTPNRISYKSHEKVWWKCSICGHEWQARIDSRTINGTNCPECAKQPDEPYVPNEFIVCEETGLIYIQPGIISSEIEGIPAEELLKNVPLGKMGEKTNYKGYTWQRYII